MKLTWLGQAGLLFETDGKIILVDPYLSDNVKNFEPKNYRRVPVDERFLQLKPDIILITHNHLDHLDKETLKYYLGADSKTEVLCPDGCFQEICKTYRGLERTPVMFNAGTEWSEGNVRFRAVRAEHSDRNAIGIILSAEGKNYYVTGDTLYNEGVFASLPEVDLFAVFLPVNGRGNNMNFADAVRFAARTGAKYAVPIHFGLFDELTAEPFDAPNRIIPKFYEEIVFPEK